MTVKWEKCKELKTWTWVFAAQLFLVAKTRANRRAINSELNQEMIRYYIVIKINEAQNRATIHMTHTETKWKILFNVNALKHHMILHKHVAFMCMLKFY